MEFSYEFYGNISCSKQIQSLPLVPTSDSTYPGFTVVDSSTPTVSRQYTCDYVPLANINNIINTVKNTRNLCFTIPTSDGVDYTGRLTGLTATGIPGNSGYVLQLGFQDTTNEQISSTTIVDIRTL